MPDNDSPSNHSTSASNRGTGQRIEDIPSIVMRSASLTLEPRTAARSSSSLSSPNRRTTVEDVKEGHIDNAVVETDAEGRCTPPARKVKLGRAGSSLYKTRPPAVPIPPTPVKPKINRQKTVSDREYAAQKYRKHADDALDYFVGPMPVREFIDEFLPFTSKVMPDAKRAFVRVPRLVKDEMDLYYPMVEAINEGQYCPSVVFLVTATCGVERGNGEMKPDVCGHDDGDVCLMEEVGTNKTSNRSGKAKANAKRKRYRANVPLAELIMEFKGKVDIFDDKGKHFLAWKNHPPGSPMSSRLKENCGQLVAYSAECFARQHRAFLFSVLIVGTNARLFRWDRAGIVVTESFDYQRQPNLLCEFLWRFGHADPVQRGFDSSVTVASKEEETLFKSLIAEEVAFQLDISPNDSEVLNEALGRQYEEGKITKMKVYDKKGNYDECLISVPTSLSTGTAGRGTRGFWGVRLAGRENGKETGEVVFVKDSWRMDVPPVEEEGVAYEDLNGHAVLNVSTALSFGNVLNEEYIVNEEDIPDAGPVNLPVPDIENEWLDANVVMDSHLPQTTRSQDFVRARWVHESLKLSEEGPSLRARVFKHTHYRLVLGEVGYPLEELTGSLELFEIGICILEALISAYEKCGRLHRDVSAGNVIIVRSRKDRRRRGILIDWEFSCKVDRTGSAKDYHRSGTMPFMSVASLQKDGANFRHDRTDDFESLFYVMIFACIKWLPYSHKVDLGKWMDDFFCGGHLTKQDHMLRSHLFSVYFTFEKEPINKFFARMYNHLSTMSYNVRRSGAPSEWRDANLRQCFYDARKELSDVVENGGSEKDKCINLLDDFPVPKQHAPKATHTPSRMASTPLFPSDYQKSKRSLMDAFDWSGERSGKEEVNAEPDAKKRKFVDSDDQPEGAVEAAHSAMLVPPSTMATIESGVSTCSMEVLKDGSSRSNKSRSRKVPRRSSRLSGKAKSDTSAKSKASSLSAKSKGSGISTKSSKSSLRHPRKARSDTSRRSH